MFNEYPYRNIEDLNLDYMQARVRNLEKIVEQFVALESVTFADPILWDITKQYAKDVVVLDEDGNAYMSKKPVPTGVYLTNTDYWLEIFNFMDYVKSFNSNLTIHIEAHTDRATSAYNVNDWLLWDDVLYKVTNAIAPDDLFIIGTNIERFTVEDFCRAWQAYMINTIAQYKRDIDASELQYKNDIDASEIAYRNQLAGDIAATTNSLQAQLDAAIAGATVDSEVINARVGADGMTYSTLGDAIRSQIGVLVGIYKMYTDTDEPINLVNALDIVKDTDINSSTGALISDAAYYATGKIYANFTKKISVGNSDYDYAYCYDSTDTYLGRVSTAGGVIIANTYPTVAYIRGLNHTALGYTITVRYGVGNLCPCAFGVLYDNKDMIDLITDAGNLYDKRFRLDNMDILSSGKFTTSATYRATHPIKIDPTKNIAVASSSVNYFYCYDEDFAYLGRLSMSSVTRIADTYPTTKYIFILELQSATGELTVVYSDYPIASGAPAVLDLNTTPVNVIFETYNTGDCTGVGSPTRVDYARAIAAGNADFVAIQCDITYPFGDTVRNTLLKQYKDFQNYDGGAYNNLCCASKYPLITKTKIDYNDGGTPDPYDHPFFYFTTALIDGRLVAIANVHWDWRDNGWRRYQIRQVSDFIDDYDYAIIIGDTNPEDRTAGSWNDPDNKQLVYNDDWAYLTAAGFKWANADFLGTYDTLAAGTDPNGPYDQIFVKGDITINNIYVRKYDYMNDHLIFGANITIY